ncbi:beta-galactosidase GalB [Granulicella cerasi]|uniref:Beta-galactosidase GalB n=1 Tax=Granulicella cerasi TaxID=741063 RepID=A0ABW1ZE73_9BACT|nr:beta-galactosidase GalB [Granulicella cerasi]
MTPFSRAALAVLVSAGTLFPAIAAAQQPREKVLIDRDWRFTHGDPAGVDSRTLLYDVRPVAKSDDQKPHVAEAVSDAAKLEEAKFPVLKPWILPSGDAFLPDASKHHARPAGNPGESVAYTHTDFDDSGWRKLDLPHDWAIEGPFTDRVGGGMGKLPSPGIAWYRKALDVPVSDKGKRIFLQVDGAMSYAEVWCNGKLVGGWPYGYATWQLDLTPYLVPGGKNELAIRLDNPTNFSRWYPGAGIYRNVWLVKTQPVHVGEWGTFVTTPIIDKDSARVDLKVTVDNDSAAATDAEVNTKIYALDANGKQIGAPLAAMKPVKLSLAAGAHEDALATANLAHPKLWGPPPTQQPNRYVAVTTITQRGKLVDRYETRFGVRKIEYKPDGLYVNGERIRIQGVNQHHDLGTLGSAFNENAAKRQLDELREAGANAIRMSHNPPAPELLELTDSMGFLVMDEIFDGWVRQKTTGDFHLIFPDWHEQDLRSFMRRDRNHPSVFLWSVGNEVGEQQNGEVGVKVAQEMVKLAHEEDATRPATASMNFAKSDSGFAKAMDVVSINYQGEGIRDTVEYTGFKGLKTLPQYDNFRAAFPQRMIFTSESAAAISSRDSYLFPVPPGKSYPARDGSGSDDKTHQVSAYELYAADFGSSADKVFSAQDHHPYVAGEFVWTGWDYIGEPTPYYTSRSSYFGFIDLAGFPKDRFYLYQSRWRADLPMVHILPHWTWPDRVGKVTPVHVFTSGDEAELFLNGKSLGRKKKAPFEYRLRWDDVVYQPGVLKVVAYKNGKLWATDEVKTAGAATQIKLAPEEKQIAANGTNLAFIRAYVEDKADIINPNSDAAITFSVTGAGEIVATDNGDATDLNAFPDHTRKAFHGKALVIVRAKRGEHGILHITAKADGLTLGSTSIAIR